MREESWSKTINRQTPDQQATRKLFSASKAGRSTLRTSRRKPKRVLRLPDLDHAKTAMLSTLATPDSQRCYRYAIEDFVAWYCSEPRLAFNKTVVLRYRLELEAGGLAPATINLRLAAVRRLAYEAADSGLLSPELAASIRRVSGHESASAFTKVFKKMMGCSPREYNREDS